MNAHILFTAYRLSINAAQTIVLIRGESDVEMQMRDRNNGRLHSIQLQR